MPTTTEKIKQLTDTKMIRYGNDGTGCFYQIYDVDKCKFYGKFAEEDVLKQFSITSDDKYLIDRSNV